MLALSCGTPAPPADSGPGTSPDAGPEEAAAVLACRRDAELEIGRCATVDGAPCSGSEAGAEAVFTAMPPEGGVAPVVGPQGSTMFALAVRAEGIEPGDPDAAFSVDNPVLELELLAEGGGRLVSTYRGRGGFRPSAGAPARFENALIFVIVDEPSAALREHRFEVRALLRDSAGTLRCGATQIFAGG